VGGDAGAEHVDPADNFVARDNRIFYAGQFAIEDMKVGPAYAASADFDAYFSCTGQRGSTLLHLQRRARSR
jgi:hypothetical protein